MTITTEYRWAQSHVMDDVQWWVYQSIGQQRPMGLVGEHRNKRVTAWMVDQDTWNSKKLGTNDMTCEEAKQLVEATVRMNQ